MALQIRRGTEAERTAGGGVVFAEGELIYVTDTDALFIGDGSTAGGVKLSDNAGAVLGTYITADTINSTIDLQQDLDLNGNDIIGTGNININGTITATGNVNIGDDADSDTVDFTAKITSTLTPNADSTYNIGAANARWNNGYFTGLVVDGQVDAVAVNADVVADNSTTMVDVSANTFAGDLTGNVTGNVTGNLTGNVTGNVTGDLDGAHNGTVGATTPNTGAFTTASASGGFTGNLTGDVTGNVTGNLTGNVTGDIKGTDGTSVLSPNTNPSDAELSVLNVTATGVIAGNLTGNVTGNVIGNAAGDHTGTFTGAITATGTLDGDVTGSVFADDSAVLVDAVAGNIPASVINGTLTNDLVGNVTGDLTGNVITNSIDSSDSTAINVIPITTFNARINAQQEIQVGDVDGVFIDDNGIDAWSNIRPSTLSINTIVAQEQDYTTELEINSNTVFAHDVTVEGKFQAFGDRAVTAIHRTQLSETNSGFFVTEYSGNPTDPTELQDIANYDIKTKIIETVADFGTAVKFANMDSTTRDGLTAEAGMVIFNTTTTKLQVYTGSAWADLH